MDNAVATGPRVSRSPRTVELYLASLIGKPFAATLAVALVALLLERLLRLLDLITSKGASPLSVLRALLDLVPHYLGLALPAALFLGVYSVIAQLGRGNELEAMQNAGLSLGRIGRPFMLTAVVVAAIGFGLYGYAQPLTRYAYRADIHAVVNGGWDATIPAGEVTRISRNLIATADEHDRRTGTLTGILVFRRDPDGRETVTTGRTGSVVLSQDGTEALLQINGGEQVAVGPDERLQTLNYGAMQARRPFSVHLAAFRPRGEDEREMTLGELWWASRDPASKVPLRRLQGELHGRLVRTLSLALLPFLAIPVGLAAKRARRPYGVVVGMVVLVLYNHVVQLAQSLGAVGKADPRLLLWGAFALFAGFCLVLFRRAERFAGEGPFDRLFDRLDQATEAMLRLLRRGRRVERQA